MPGRGEKTGKGAARKRLRARARARARVARTAGVANDAKELERALQQAIEESGLLRAGQRVGVAVSGGADSVALLLLLAELRRKLGLILVGLHFHHGLRGRAADAEDRKSVV